MKPHASIMKQLLVSSLLVVYIAVVSINILYLPIYNTVVNQHPVTSTAVQLRKATGSANSNIQFHRVFKSIITDKSDNVKYLKNLTSLFVIVFIGFGLFNLNINRSYYKGFFLNNRHTFLRLCFLRL